MDDEWLALVREEVAETLAPTTLAGAPIIAVLRRYRGRGCLSCSPRWMPRSTPLLDAATLRAHACPLIVSSPSPALARSSRAHSRMARSASARRSRYCRAACAREYAAYKRTSARSRRQRRAADSR